MHTLDEMLMTNLDVTTHVVTWLITLVADNEDAKVELLREMEENSDQLHEYLTKSDTHLQRCFQESLRLRPPLSKITACTLSLAIRNTDSSSLYAVLVPHSKLNINSNPSKCSPRAKARHRSKRLTESR